MRTTEAVREALGKWSAAEAAGDDAALATMTPAGGRARRGAGVGGGAPRPAAAAPATVAVGPRIVLRASGEPYHVRKIGDIEDIEILRTARAKDIPVLLHSSPGTGKTAMFDAAFADGGFEYVGGTADTEVADFLGTYVQHPGGEFVWIDGPLTRAMERGVPLLVDEVALIDTKVMACVYGAMDGRREVNITANPERGIVKAAEGFYVVGACNPNAPGARMSEALTSRFIFHIEVTTDYDLAKTLGVPAKAVTAAKNLDTKRRNGELTWAPQMRELLGFKAVYETFGQAMALSNIVAQAPEMDRVIVAEIISRTFGTEVRALAVG